MGIDSDPYQRTPFTIKEDFNELYRLMNGMELREMDIDTAPFSALKGNADSEFNNRSHRKITVIDGCIGNTGGINFADECINEAVKFGHWKDVGLRLEGDAVKELASRTPVSKSTNTSPALSMQGYTLQMMSTPWSAPST